MTSTQQPRPLRVAVEGCGHGTLNAIYAAAEESCKARGWDGVDVLIICGDFQAVRNAFDLTVMSCPVKYRKIGDFHEYYSGTRSAPYLTIFVGGNHEASSHLWELYYGGWVAPNIYYMGAANVVRLGPIRIAGMTGIWKGYNYNKPHHERLPYNHEDVKSIYSIRELDVRKLLQLRTQVDIGISHDWPRFIERDGDENALFRMKPHFQRESKERTLGSLAALYVMDRLRPPYWFAAHMHCKFAATKVYQAEVEEDGRGQGVDAVPPAAGPAPTRNADEIDLELDDEITPPSAPGKVSGTQRNEDEIELDLDDEPAGQGASVEASAQNQESRKDMGSHQSAPGSQVSQDLRAQLPASFQKPASRARIQPGQPAPLDITNKAVRFLALDKCLPGRKFLQLLEVEPRDDAGRSADESLFRFEYDPEWLAITRAFAGDLTLGGDGNVRPPGDLGEAHYRSLVEAEEAWVHEHIVVPGRLEIPRNFEVTAPVHAPDSPEIVSKGPCEYTNPQTVAFCDLVGIENKFAATDDERQVRMKAGPRRTQTNDGRRGGRGRGRGRGGGRGRD